MMLPTTKEWLKKLETYKEEIKNEWALGALTADTLDKTIQLNSEAIGKISVIDEIVIELEGIGEEDEE